VVPDLLAQGQTPEEWSKSFLDHGVHVSPRLIRSRARKTGNYYKLGHLMLLLPSQVEALLEQGQPDADQSPNPGKRPIGYAGGQV
jgi:hypothetical protein